MERQKPGQKSHPFWLHGKEGREGRGRTCHGDTSRGAPQPQPRGPDVKVHMAPRVRKRVAAQQAGESPGVQESDHSMYCQHAAVAQEGVRGTCRTGMHNQPAALVRAAHRSTEIRHRAHRTEKERGQRLTRQCDSVGQRRGVRRPAVAARQGSRVATEPARRQHIDHACIHTTQRQRNLNTRC